MAMNQRYVDQGSPAPEWRRRAGAWPESSERNSAQPRSWLKSLTGSKLARRGFRIASWLMMLFTLGALVLVAAGTVPVLFGYHNYNVSGASMEPALQLGSVAVTKPTSPRALEVGDIIAYRNASGAKPVLHRIVEVTTIDGERRFITQGDQNAAPDPTPVTLTGYGDRVIYSVPYAGYILNFAGSLPGKLVLIGLPLISLGGLLWRDASRDKKRDSRTGRSVDDVAAPDGQATREDVSPVAPGPAVTPAPASGLRLVTSQSVAPTIRLHEIPLLKIVPLAVGMVPLAAALEMAFLEREAASAMPHQERHAA